MEQTIEIPAISLAGEIIEMPDIRIQEEIRQVVNPQVQHVVGTDDVENHIVREKINQMIKHAPRVQVVEKTVEEHFATIAHLASRIPAILKFGDETGDETGEDPFVKVKSSTTELINKLQDALELLDKNQLAENDELGFGQACVSEHFPEKRGRNLNPESEVFMTRIFQIWVNHSRSLGPGSKSRQLSGEMNRPRQSKQRQVWVRFEGQTKAVDVGGTEEEVRKRIQTAIGGAREEEIYLTSQGRRETWESVAAMENGRVVEVTVRMRGGMGKKRNKKDRNPWNTPSSGSEIDRISSADETHQQQMQEELQRKVTQTMAQVGMLDRFVEVMAAAGENEREEMLKKYEAEMPKELGEGYVAASRAAIEKAVREKGDEMERKRKVEVIREGVRRRYFRESSGPEDILDCGIHSGRKFEDVYLDHKSYAQWVLELGQPHMWTLRCFQYFLLRLMDLERIVEGRKRSRAENERGEVGSE